MDTLTKEVTEWLGKSGVEAAGIYKPDIVARMAAL